MILMDVPDQQCMSFPQEQITLHLVEPSDSMQIVKFQPTFNRGLAMIVVYLPEKQKADTSSAVPPPWSPFKV
jgi:hypothetical protein